MFSKLAFRNVKRSIRDYAVYFLTLMLGVCIFYVFNSMDAQRAMMDITKSGLDSMMALTQIIDVVSVFVSIVLAFLIIYANKFMIRRRKKELGIYITLGMPQKKISGMLVLETFVIGILALVAGIVLGVLLSQGLAVVTASMFQINIRDFHFVYSQSAFIKSIIYFGIIFVVVMLFNYIAVSKLKLIDLLYADRKNEELKIRKTWVSTTLLVLGALFVAASYALVISFGAGGIVIIFVPAMIVNVVGTLLLFASFSGFMLKGAQANKKFYFKGLNMFTLRQLASKINTNFVSMTFICTMLFLTIVILSTVGTFNTAFNSETGKLTPFDASFTMYEADGGESKTIKESLPKLGINEEEFFDQSYEYTLYATDTLMKEITNPYTEMLTPGASITAIETYTLDAIKQSDFNKLLEISGKAPIAIGENEYAVMSDQDAIHSNIRQAIDSGREISINGKQLSPAQLPVQTQGLWTSHGGYGDMVVIVPDSVADGLVKDMQVYVANYIGGEQNAEETQRKLDLLYDNFESYRDNAGIRIVHATKIDVKMASSGLTTSMIFIGIYMGLIFLIAGAAVLALQQLSEAADSKKRYELLKKLGTEEKMINAALVKQVGTYFLLPLILAVIHSTVGMWVMNEGIIGVFNVDVIANSAVAALFITLVYGGYFIATYLGCKNIVHTKYERQQ